MAGRSSTTVGPQLPFTPNPRGITVSDVTVALSGSAGTFSPGTLGVTETLALSGTAGTFSAGTLSAPNTIALSGSAATFAAGTVVPSSTVAQTGSAANFAAGNMTGPAGPNIGMPIRQNAGPMMDFASSPRGFTLPTTDVTTALTGSGLAFSAGTLTPSSTVAITGQAGTFSAGTVVPGLQLSIVGTAANFSTGTAAAAIACALTGQASTLAAGTLAPAPSKVLSGSSATWAQGTLVPSETVGLTGQVANFSSGVVSPPGASNAALTGQAGSFSQGSPGVSVTAGLSGTALTAAAGTLSPYNGVTLSGSAFAGSSGILLARLTLGITGSAAQFSGGVVLPPSDKAVALTGMSAAFQIGNVLAIGAVLEGSPRYVIRRPRKRRFTVSSNSYSQFEPKDPAEAVKLEFDFADDLDTGVTFTGSPTATVSLVSGTDASPSSLLNGLPRFDVTSTQIIVPVHAGVTGCVYSIKVAASTTDSLVSLAMTGTIQILEGA